MINLYNIHDFAQIRVTGDGLIAHKLGEQLNTFESSRSCSELIHIIIDDEIKGYDTTTSLGNDRKLSFSNKKGLFFIKKDDGLIAIDGLNSSKNKKKILVTSDFDISILMLFIEFFLRQYGVEKNIALLHGAAAENNGKGLVFFGWQGAGKTAAVMSCVNQGFKFMSEDKIWITPDKILAYPRYIRINSSNIHLFLARLTILQRLRYYLGVFLEVRTSSKLMPSIVKSLVRKGLIIPSIKFNLKDLVTSAEFSEEANIFKLYYLERGLSCPTDRDCSKELEKISNHIACYEWNHRLRDFFCAHDSLFTDRDSWVDMQENLIAKEEKLLRNIFSVNDVTKITTSFKQVFIDVDKLI